jgi:putative endopeptidase
MKNYFLSISASAILLGSIFVTNIYSIETNMSSNKAIETKNFDKDVKISEDFFRHVNGGWMKTNPIPAEKSRFGSFDALQDNAQKHIKGILEEMSKNTKSKKGSIEQKLGDFYTAAMDESTIEKLGFTPIKKYLNEIKTLKSVNDAWKLIAKYHSEGDGFVFGLGPEQDPDNSKKYIATAYQGGLGLPDRDYYLKDDERSKTLRTEYIKMVTKFFVLTGENETVASSKAKNVINFETELAQNSKTKLEMRDPQTMKNKMDVTALKALSPELDWTYYFKTIGFPNPGTLNITSPKFITAVGLMTKSQSLDAWKDYLAFHVISGSAPSLSSNFVNARFDFYGKVISGQKEMKPRWKRAIDMSNASLGEAIGKIYVGKYFPSAAKTRMVELVSNLKVSLDERIGLLDWMSDATKKQAKDKLATIKVKIGYPEKFLDYATVEISKKSFFDNMQNASKYNNNIQMKKINKDVDADEWGMTPQTVNAYYNPASNEIVFPAAILQAPFFDMNADDAVNYGGIGAVIGHEITHGFDDQGRQYDKEGNLKDWWTAEDAKKYDEKVHKIVLQYNKFTPLKDNSVNGDLTLGENIADLGGVTIAYNALKLANKGKKIENIDGFNPEQRFFLNYAQVWRQNIRDEELMMRLKTDPHSPAEYRVNGIVSNLPEFYNAFGIKQGDILWKPEVDRARVW